MKFLWQDSNIFTYIQYDQYRNAKQNLISFQTYHQHHIANELTSQGIVISSIFKYASKVSTNIWSNVQQKLPRNIFNFSLKYLTSTLATQKSLSKWSISQSSAWSFCLQSETLQPIVSSWKLYLEHSRYTWRHDSVLNCIAMPLLHFQIVHYMLISLLFYPLLLSQVMLFGLTFS